MPVLADLRVGTETAMADAVTRSRLGDGRVLGWYGEPGVVLDAEIADSTPPAALAARYGADRFWERWTAAECGAKATGVPMHLWLREHGLSPGSASDAVVVETLTLDDLVVSIGRPRPAL